MQMARLSKACYIKVALFCIVKKLPENFKFPIRQYFKVINLKLLEKWMNTKTKMLMQILTQKYLLMQDFKYRNTKRQ